MILLNGGFPGRKHGIKPWPKPKKEDHPRWLAKYNDGHSLIWGYGEHPYAQLYTWAVCRDPCAKLVHNDGVVLDLNFVGH